MAGLMKLRHMHVMQRCAWNHINKITRGISTSKRNSDSAATSTCEAKPTTEAKNWVSYGFDYKSQEEDTNAHHSSFLMSVTLCLVFGGFCWAYAPDVHMRDWAQREAFIELRRREKREQPLINPNYVEPRTLKLPKEKELCDFEIII